jgi:hypothetical protein
VYMLVLVRMTMWMPLDASECVRGCDCENVSSHPSLEMLVAELAGWGRESGNERVDVEASGGGNEDEGTHSSCCGCVHTMVNYGTSALFLYNKMEKN